MLRRARFYRFMFVLLLIAVLATPVAVFAEPEPASTVYVVQRGDTLSRIAARYGVSVGALAAANGIRNANLVYTGQRLLIPGAVFRIGARHEAPGGLGACGRSLD